jgi:hypothetical protein
LHFAFLDQRCRLAEGRQRLADSGRRLPPATTVAPAPPAASFGRRRLALGGTGRRFNRGANRIIVSCCGRRRFRRLHRLHRNTTEAYRRELCLPGFQTRPYLHFRLVRHELFVEHDLDAGGVPAFQLRQVVALLIQQVYGNVGR